MDAINFKNIIDDSDFNSWQVLMSELDSTIDRMRCVCRSKMKDAYEIEQFDEFWNDVTNNEAIVVSVTDDANLYELSDDSTLIILFSNLNERMIIFDKQDKSKIFSKILKY